MSNSLVAVHPELIVEWSDRNLPLTPDSVTFGSNKKVWWKGTCGHEWQTSIKARSNGEKCPICSGARVVTGINDLSTLKPELASEWSEKNEIKPTEVSIGSHKKVLWKCKLGHEWTATVKSRTINKTGCPYCSHNKVLAGFNDLATVLPEVAVEWSNRNEKKPTEVTAFANSKAWWKCKTCGYSHAISTDSLRAMGSYSGNIAYCIEPGTGQHTGDTLTEKNEDYFNNLGSNGTISGDDIRLNIGRILQYGYCGSISTSWKSQNSDDADKLSHAIATQLLIWETIVGERDESFNHKSPGSYDAILDHIQKGHPL